LANIKHSHEIGYTNLSKYFKVVFLPKFIRFIIILFTGLTIAFLVSRLNPLDPANMLIQRLTASYGANILRPEEIETFRKTLLALFGRDRPLWEQYLSYLTGVFTFNFGPSFTYFPTSVSSIISSYLPWTVFLLLFSTIVSWIIGITMGVFASIFERRTSGKILNWVSLLVYPIPITILALVFLVLFAAQLRVYTISPGGGVKSFGFDLKTIIGMFSKAWLPSLTLVFYNTMVWALGTKGLTDVVRSEDYVRYAVIRGLQLRYIYTRYLLKGVLPPQLTALGLALGGIFSGAMVIEQAFSYPGLGSLLALAVASNDYPIMLGIVSYSIIGVALAAFILDLIYPLIDPRIRYGVG